MRDLIITLLTRVLSVPCVPTGSTRSMCKQLRQAFAAGPSPVASNVTSGETDALVQRLCSVIGRPSVCSGCSAPRTPIGTYAMCSTTYGCGVATHACGKGAATVATNDMRPICEKLCSAAATAGPVTAGCDEDEEIGAASRHSPGSAAAGLSREEEEAEAEAEAEATARSEAIVSPQGSTKRAQRERRVMRQLADSEHYAGVATSASGHLLDSALSRSVKRRRRLVGHGTRERIDADVQGCGDGYAVDEYVPSPHLTTSMPIGADRQLRMRKGALCDPTDTLDVVVPPCAAVSRDVVRGIGMACSGRNYPTHVYVVVHAIDSGPMRSEESQALLAEIARIPQVHLIASCSHCHAAYLWDARKAQDLNWVWVRAGAGTSYSHESTDTVHQLLGCLYESAAGTEAHSAQVVLGHLTSNACEVFKMLVQFQLEHPRSAGLSFPELYQRARANFFATSEGALRKHINEFQTHDLVRTRQGPGGQQCYWCHFPGETLQQLLEQSTEGMPLS